VLANLFDPGAVVKAKVNIMGDPDFLMHDSPGSLNEVYRQFYESDGFTINPNGGQVFFEIYFKEGVDYNNRNGLMTINDQILLWNYPGAVAAHIKGISYRLLSVESNFSKGKFVQELIANINSLPNAIEDADVNNREIYFVATGVSGSVEKTYMGRVYQLKLDASDPLKGTLKIVADGDVSSTGANVKGTDIINPDNLCVTENYVYIQEDGDSFWPEATHNSLIWQYNIATGSKKVFMDMAHGDANMLNTIYNPAGANQLKKGIWEHGAMVDISDVIGVPGTFTINVHAHTWIDGDKFLNPSKATSVQTYKSGGQTLIITNVPR
jgi:hypothetical protein